MSTALHIFGYTALAAAAICGFLYATFGTSEGSDDAMANAILSLITGAIAVLSGGAWLVLIIIKAASA